MKYGYLSNKQLRNIIQNPFKTGFKDNTKNDKADISLIQKVGVPTESQLGKTGQKMILYRSSFNFINLSINIKYRCILKYYILWDEKYADSPEFSGKKHPRNFWGAVLTKEGIILDEEAFVNKGGSVCY